MARSCVTCWQRCTFLTEPPKEEDECYQRVALCNLTLVCTKLDTKINTHLRWK